MRDDSPWDKEGFRLRNIRFHQTVSRKKTFILVTLTVLDFDVHLNMKYKIFSKQNFSLQCPGTTTCVVAKPLVFITPMRYIPYTFFCLINLILARPSLLSSICWMPTTQSPNFHLRSVLNTYFDDWCHLWLSSKLWEAG